MALAWLCGGLPGHSPLAPAARTLPGARAIEQELIAHMLDTGRQAQPYEADWLVAQGKLPSGAGLGTDRQGYLLTGPDERVEWRWEAIEPPRHTLHHGYLHFVPRVTAPAELAAARVD